ncbi:hypothetical protein EJ02DRAFT_424764 [Clathrospora elynae]|uniref:Uncharacterized protein n=1 Tax=Clathrospora elynae TaxID=706981 RepID=A0A6A5SFY5_9PLEO|nr:hypothetical protein EJ02DRAFT_424764 [Clathrospora elynae]
MASAEKRKTWTKSTLQFEAALSRRDGRYIIYRLYRTRPSPPDRDDIPNVEKQSISKSYASFTTNKGAQTSERFAFQVGLFQTCRQINDEAASLFYGCNMFVFESVPHLYSFLLHFRHRLPLIHKLGVAKLHGHLHMGLKHMGPAFQSKLELLTVFLLLASAVHLEAFYMNVSIYQPL